MPLNWFDVPKFNFTEITKIYQDQLICRTGAKYNVELMQSCQDSLQSLVESTWPGIENEEPLDLGHGATQVSWRLNLIQSWNPIQIEIQIRSGSIIIWSNDLMFETYKTMDWNWDSARLKVVV